MEQALSPTLHLDKLLHAAPSEDAGGLRFMVPEAPLTHHRRAGRAIHGLRQVVQKLFGASKELAKDTNDNKPLISSSYVMKRDEQREANGFEDQRPRYSSLSGRIRKTMASFSAKLKSPSPRPAAQSLLGTPQSSALFEYNLSADELQAGLTSTLPSPIANKDTGMGLEDRIALNYKDCMKHRNTCLPISLPELLVLLARESTENVQLQVRERESRLYLTPLDVRMASCKFLSRSQPTRIGRNCGQLVKVKSRVVSRNHCQIFKEERADGSGSCYFITDVGSHSGTFVNGMRLSPTGSISSPYALTSGDIVQLGADFNDSSMENEEDEMECVDLKAISFLVLIGSPLRSAVKGNLEMQESNQGIDAQLISNDKISRLYRKVMGKLSGEDGACLYVEFGDLLHENSFGHALFARRDGPSYAIRFNNYRLTWEAVINEIKPGAPCLFSECAVGKEDQFVIYSNDMGKRKKVAKINLKDKKLATVSPTNEQRPLQKESKMTECQPANLVIPRPASPYVTISQSSTGLRTPMCSPRIEFMTTELRDTLIISKPEVPFYLISPNEIIGKDRNNPLKERLLGQGQIKKNTALKWGRRAITWHGNMAVCKDDALVVLGILLQQLLCN